MEQYVLRDFDGTIADTQKIHAQVESDLLYTCGVDTSAHENILKYAGYSTRDQFYEQLNQWGYVGDKKKKVEDLLEVKREVMAVAVKQWIEANPWAIELIQQFAILPNVTQAIVCSSKKVYIYAALEALGIAKHFPIVISTIEDVERGFPSADAYEKALELLGWSSSEAIGIDDSVAGLMAMNNAQITPVCLLSEWRGPMDYPSCALYIRDFHEVQVEELLQLTGKKMATA